MPQKLKGTLTYILKVIKNLESCQYDTVVSTLVCHLCSLAQDWVTWCHPNGFYFDYNFDFHTSSEQDPVSIILNVKSTLILTQTLSTSHLLPQTTMFDSCDESVTLYHYSCTKWVQLTKYRYCVFYTYLWLTKLKNPFKL